MCTRYDLQKCTIELQQILSSNEFKFPSSHHQKSNHEEYKNIRNSQHNKISGTN